MTSLLLLFALGTASACAHNAPPPASLANGRLAYARAGNSADTLAVELGDMAERYCKSRHEVVTVDGRDDVPGNREVEVTLKFHCRPAGPSSDMAPSHDPDDDISAEGVGPWAR